MPPTDVNRQLAEKDFALVFGIANYPRFGEGATESNLGGPVHDAKEVTRWLAEDAGVPCQNIRCITSEGEGDCKVVDGAYQLLYDGSVRPEAADIARPFEHFLNTSSNIIGGPSALGRRLWIYMAGHGMSPAVSMSDVCIFPANANWRGLVSNFCATKWADGLSRCQPFDEIVLWMDCCQRTCYGLSPYAPDIVDVEYRPAPAKRFYLGAVSHGGIAFEAPDPPPDGPVRGLFTKTLLGALRGGVQLSPSGYVTSLALRDFFEGKTCVMRATVAGQDVTQRARVLAGASDNLDLVHVQTAVLPTVRVPTGLSPGTSVELLDHTRTRLGDFAVAADGAVLLTIPSGLYQLRGPDDFNMPFDSASLA